MSLNLTEPWNRHQLVADLQFLHLIHTITYNLSQLQIDLDHWSYQISQFMLSIQVNDNYEMYDSIDNVSGTLQKLEEKFKSKSCWPLTDYIMIGSNKRSYILQLKAAGLFKYVWPFDTARRWRVIFFKALIAVQNELPWTTTIEKLNCSKW